VRFSIASLPLLYRRPFVVALQLAAAVASNYAAFWLRFDGDIPPGQLLNFLNMLPWLIVLRGLSFIPFRLYEGLWRYAGLWDLRNIFGATLAGSMGFFVLAHVVFGLVSYPRSVFLTDSLLLILLLGGMRMSRRLHREVSGLNHDRRVLIYGAGDAGETIVRVMRTNPEHEYAPVGFIDDDASKRGHRIHGVKVLGTRHDLHAVIAATQPDAVLIAISRATPATIRSIVQALEPFKVPIQTLPSLRDLLDGKVTLNHIRTLSVEDLLDRVPVALDAEPVREIVTGKRVLITGAGGSIGAELCRQIASLNPGSLVMIDRYENGLHSVMHEMAQGVLAKKVHAVVVDVKDHARMREVWEVYRPEIVFHAAAHKHVPLMELNPCEAVLNNVRGARMLVDSAVAYGVERFVLVSTDKAVNPASVMGATKRIAEMLVQTVNGGSAGIFAAVRFGNVLASNGSVVPLFLEQIRAGGPVTVTHPEMRRYFMLISEAVSLVLQAITLAKGSDIFALEMGEQIGVLDLARNLIRLSGLAPDEDIPITFTGVRPGEKLREELIAEDEEVEPSSVDGILRIRPRTTLERAPLVSKILELESRAVAGDRAAVIGLFRTIVATYHPGQW
jgi:FlaA1/EpsC-like NDP-sugar epimerase